jgi:hypothetical protein
VVTMASAPTLARAVRARRRGTSDEVGGTRTKMEGGRRWATRGQWRFTAAPGQCGGADAVVTGDGEGLLQL